MTFNQQQNRYIIGFGLFLLLLGGSFAAQGFVPQPESERLHALITRPLTLDPRTQTSGCTFEKEMPDHECTPGAIIANVTEKDVCTSGYSGSVRNVAQSTKEKVYAAYGITHREPEQYQIDHFISLENGGSNDIANLWPQEAHPEHGYRQKIESDNYLHAKICEGEITLAQAQELTVDHWYEVYRFMQEW